MAFLDDLSPRRIQLRERPNLRPLALYLGQGNLALEIVSLSGTAEPSPPALKDAWRERLAGRGVPLLLVAIHGDRATLCGPAGEDPPIRQPFELGQVDRLCRQALAQPDRNAALRFLNEALPTLESELPGVRNEGLLSFHELSVGARRRTDWTSANSQGRAILGKEREDLLRALGFATRRNDALTSILQTRNRDRALAILLDQTETPEGASARCQGLSPVSYALALADQRGLPWVVVVQGNRIRLYPTAVGVGVGRRGRTETWVELQTGLMRDGDAGLLWLLLSAEALAEGGTLDKLLDSSRDFAADLATRLRERVYNEVVPTLATGIARARNLTNPTVEDLRLTYEMALTILFRLLFIAYAEDRDLLPYRTVDAYRHRALKTKARELLESGPMEPAADNLWREANVLFAAVAVGNIGLGVPPYDGGLFAEDPAVSRAGAALAQIALTNGVFEPALRALLLIEGRDGLGPVDFRALGVREFGTIYEGLLESELAVADQDLTTRQQRGEAVYMPARGHDEIVVRTSEIYLHNRSGARKSSGSYFTPAFAVDHLLDAALEPALDEHLERLDQRDDIEAAEAFFDFRVADIAMGSGHFLVAAVDRIERKLSQYLARRQLPGVRAELARLRQAAIDALGTLGAAVVIEDGPLLRRLVARRCIYGVDLNPLAVQLARLSIWIHTFVPGLPLSLLDHTLVRGDALVGIATIDQVLERFEQAGIGLFPVDADELLGAAKEPLLRLARLADTTPRDIALGREAMEQARVAVAPTRALCDLVLGEKVAPQSVAFQFELWPKLRPTIQAHRALRAARDAIAGLDVFHFPVAFPEVFLRRRPGFDVVMGNPPWEKVRPEHDAFWARHYPGLRGMRVKTERDRELRRLERLRPDLVRLEENEREQAERLRDAVRGLPGMNTGHPDLFRAFMGRFCHTITSQGGRFGVVLPGDAFKIKGNYPVRAELATRAATVDVQMLTNRGEWVFHGVHPQKPIARTVAKIVPNCGNCQYTFRPEFHSRSAWDSRDPAAQVARSNDWLIQFSSGLVQPTLPTTATREDLNASIGVLETMMVHPRISEHPILKVRRVYADVETNRDGVLYRVNENAKDLWPVYGGDSFDVWQPDTGIYYAQAHKGAAMDRAQEKRSRTPRTSPYGAMPRKWLDDMRTHPVLSPRIAFRNVTNRGNRRTPIAALVPANRLLVETSPWVLWLDVKHPLAHEAYLLGVMSSLIADWWMRRFVEGHVDEEAFNCLRVPAVDVGSGFGAKVVHIAGRLAAPDERFAAWAKILGVKYGPIDALQQQDFVAELDAIVARLYGLNEDQLTHIFRTFHDGWDHEARLKSTLRYFTAISHAQVPA